MDEHRPVGLDDEQPEGGREMGGEPAVVVDAAPRDDESHLGTLMRTSRCRSRVDTSDAPFRPPWPWPAGLPRHGRRAGNQAIPSRIRLIAVSPSKTRKPRPAAPPAPLGPERIEDWPDGDW